MPNQKTQQFIEWFSIPHKHNFLYDLCLSDRNADPEIDFSDPEIDSLAIFPLLEANLNGNTFYLAHLHKFFDWLCQLTFSEKISANRVLDLLLSEDAEGSMLLNKCHLDSVGKFLFALAYKGLIEYDKIFNLFIRILSRFRHKHDYQPMRFDGYAMQLVQHAALDYNMGYSAVIELLKQKIEQKIPFHRASIITVADLFIKLGGKPWGFILPRGLRRERCDRLILVLNIMKQTNFEALSDFDFKLPIWGIGIL